MSKGTSYDRKQVNIVGGNIRIEAFKSCKVGRGGPKFAIDTNNSADELVRSRLSAPVGFVEIVMSQTSADNGKLTALEAQEALLTFTVTEAQGGSEHVLTQGTIIEVPEVEYAEEAGDVTWRIEGILDTHKIEGSVNP